MSVFREGPFVLASAWVVEGVSTGPPWANNFTEGLEGESTRRDS